MRWRAFYADGRRVSSADMHWRSLPSRGLVIAVWWDAQGQRHLECGHEALVLAPPFIVSANTPTAKFYQAAVDECRDGWLKWGEYMAPEDWAAIRAEADEARTPP